MSTGVPHVHEPRRPSRVPVPRGYQVQPADSGVRPLEDGAVRRGVVLLSQERRAARGIAQGDAEEQGKG